ncbi:MAG: sigma 54-interacting transcriptional regulator, partial [Polyangiales bacterium]
MSLCTISDSDPERARELAEELYGTGEFLALPDDAGATDRRPALVLVVEPGSPHDIERRVADLGAHERAVPLFVALPLDGDYDAASYLSAGADDVLWMPLRPDELARRYRTWRARHHAQREAERVRTGLLAQQPFPHIIGRSGPMQRVFEWLHRVAGTDSSVLFLGETGTGKELLARAVHSLSPRRDAPFVAVNLSALPETLIESELFGHERGAFTGATARRRGRIEEAHGGSMFLDEIGDLNLSSQVKLLRLLEEKRFSRVCSNVEIDADFRLVCATHRNLDDMIARGEFREDLYYRINVVRIDLPPLRERTDDIPLLAQHFLERHRRNAGVGGVTLSDQAVEALKRHDWPGNVRELEHIIERAVALSHDGEIIGPDLIQTRPRRRSFREDISSFWTSGRGLREVLEDIERHILVETLERYDGNRAAAAKKLKIPRQTLQNRLRKLGIDL